MGWFGSPSEGTGKTTCEKGGRDPPNVTLDEIAKNLFSFYEKLDNFNKTEENITKKYDIKKEHKHNCWPEDDIKRAWGKIQRMNINSDKRSHWSAVILLQIVKRSFVCGECKLQAAQENRHATTDEQGCGTTPRLKGNPEERPSQSSAELETLGAAGGVQQSSGAGLETYKCKPTEDSGLGSESPLSTSGTDEASTAELRGTNCYANQNNHETKDAAFVNENEDTSVNNEQQKNALHVADVHDKENVRWEDDRRSTVGMNQACGKTQRMKGKSEERSSQSNAEPETLGAAGGDKKSSRRTNTRYSAQTYNVIQGQTATHFTRWSQVTGNPPGAGYGQNRPDVALQNEGIHGPIYIRIPLVLMSSNETLLEVQGQPVPEQDGHYRFINGSPSALIDEDLRRHKSYAMSFNNESNNAHWVYEILNRQTLAENPFRAQAGFGDPYQKGHLAAAANHRWCQEAHNDANQISNIVPQHWTLNMSPWNRAERRSQDLTKEDGIRNVHVYSGPICPSYVNTWIQDKKVPTDFFKVILVENEDGTVREPECYLMPNIDVKPYQPLEQYRTTIEEIERVSELAFRERTNVRGNDRTVRMTMEGQDGEEVQRTAAIQVQIRL